MHHEKPIHASILNMGTLQLVADSSRANIPLTRNEVHDSTGGGSKAAHANHSEDGAYQPSMPSSVASSGLNFTQFMKEAPLQFAKRRMTVDQASGPITDRANSSKRQRLIRKKEHNHTSATVAANNNNSVPSEKNIPQGYSPKQTPSGQLSSRQSSSHH